MSAWFGRDLDVTADEWPTFKQACIAAGRVGGIDPERGAVRLVHLVNAKPRKQWIVYVGGEVRALTKEQFRLLRTMLARACGWSYGPHVPYLNSYEDLEKLWDPQSANAARALA